VLVVDGLARRCASQEGNALAVCPLLGLAADERVALLARSLLTWQWLFDALAALDALRRPDGTWEAGGYWWKAAGTGRDAPRGHKAWNAEVVDWGRSGPNEMITLNALRVLRAVRSP
jgi:hypothetical protein